jgi:acetoin utilization protein AcuB
MIVADLMTPQPMTVKSCDTLQVAHEIMEAGRFRQVPVVDDGKLTGIVTDRDLRQYLGQLNHIRVDTVMSAHPFSAHPSTPIEQAAHILVTNKLGSLPVVDNGKLVGIITASDMLHALEAILGHGDDGSVRIDLDVAGSGEITAAVSLTRTICPVLAMGTYNQKAANDEVLYLRVPAAGAQHAAYTLRQYGFRVLAVHQESALHQQAEMQQQSQDALLAAANRYERKRWTKLPVPVNLRNPNPQTRN